jgi:hypothetical protein
VSPKRVERLEKTLAQVARDQGLDQKRLRRWVSFLALCGVLERAVAEGDLHGYYLKGGVAMEIRFATGARATKTKDMDVGLDGERSDRLKGFERALTLGFDAFTFRLKAQTRSMDLADTVRVPVAVQYRSRAWQTVAQPKTVGTRGAAFWSHLAGGCRPDRRPRSVAGTLFHDGVDPGHELRPCLSERILLILRYAGSCPTRLFPVQEQPVFP